MKKTTKKSTQKISKPSKDAKHVSFVIQEHIKTYGEAYIRCTPGENGTLIMESFTPDEVGKKLAEKWAQSEEGKKWMSGIDLYRNIAERLVK
jgi:hypothetical protein